MRNSVPRRDRTRIDMSRAEQWVVHHVVIAEIEASYEARESPPWWVLSVLEKLEDRPVRERDADGGPTFSCYEAWRVRRALCEYAESPETPTADVTAAVGVARRLDAAFVEPPAAIT
ncbi:hypothetical protein [Natranaeroarchaeum aerophilus]|uniref:Uncharacterized protein n=1 Tax=Natranaeroarchaeum aerophilus TaxID=2917711 RepID=A0AAE3K4A3_9EURY|nr:hypothetical protein [Natranaeroarchaeum aerophilus]MCL9812470.1 hypothetical protein [Natranaeroarchaeum aerophilus]